MSELDERISRPTRRRHRVSRPSPQSDASTSPRPTEESAPTAASSADAVWSPDVLGPGFESREIPLPRDFDGELIATLVRRRADVPSRRAVLYLHGFCDYFFQTELADFFGAAGVNFYALDLRRYGRSLRPHQMPNYVADLRDYFVELDAATRIIRQEDGNDQSLLLMAHSTGGLIGSLWAHRLRDLNILDGVVLNSPWFDLAGAWWLRTIGTYVIDVLGRYRPYTVIPRSLGWYGRSLHRAYGGEWDFDPSWKPVVDGFPIRAGWLRAIRIAHHVLQRGLDIRCPVLVMCSTRSVLTSEWSEDIRRADAVLDVEQIARWSPQLGRHVTVVRIPDGIHDLVLSPRPVRERVYDELRQWLTAYTPVFSTT